MEKLQILLCTVSVGHTKYNIKARTQHNTENSPHARVGLNRRSYAMYLLVPPPRKNQVHNRENTEQRFEVRSFHYCRCKSQLHTAPNAGIGRSHDSAWAYKRGGVRLILKDKSSPLNFAQYV